MILYKNLLFFRFLYQTIFSLLVGIEIGDNLQTFMKVPYKVRNYYFLISLITTFLKMYHYIFRRYIKIASLYQNFMKLIRG